MVRIGRRAEAMRSLLISAGLTEYPRVAPPPRLADVPDSLVQELLGLYRRLGGVEAHPTLRPGPWDLVFEGPVVVELDEELHFNRYRDLTLAASWGDRLPWTPAYRIYCQNHEAECVAAGTWGKRWTNPSCERPFGAAGPAGDLADRGAPRWKQRALYDAMKDLAAVTTAEVRLARVAIHDIADGVRLGDVLDGPVSVSPTAIRALVEARTAVSVGS
jgi:hypothetical protein